MEEALDTQIRIQHAQAQLPDCEIDPGLTDQLELRGLNSWPFRAEVRWLVTLSVSNAPRCQRTISGMMCATSLEPLVVEGYLAALRQRGAWSPKETWFLLRAAARERGHMFPHDTVRPMRTDWAAAAAVSVMETVKKKYPHLTELAIRSRIQKLVDDVVPPTCRDKRCKERKPRSDKGKQRKHDREGEPVPVVDRAVVVPHVPDVLRPQRPNDEDAAPVVDRAAAVPEVPDALHPQGPNDQHAVPIVDQAEQL